jgi:hypothetical protein
MYNGLVSIGVARNWVEDRKDERFSLGATSVNKQCVMTSRVKTNREPLGCTDIIVLSLQHHAICSFLAMRSIIIHPSHRRLLLLVSYG